MENAHLYRSRDDAMIGGVCGGLGDYLGIDPTFIRLFFVLLALAANGIGLLIYFLLWVVMPLESQRRRYPDFKSTVQSGSDEIVERTRTMGEDLRSMVQRPSPHAGLIIGAALIILGAFYLLENLNLSWLRWLNFDILWPLLLIAGGLALLLRRSRGVSNGR